MKSLSINGTTIANNKVTAGTQSTDGTTVYGLEYEYGTLNTKQLLFKVTDTRNYAVELKTIISDSIVINYVPLTAVTTFKRITPTGGKVGLVFNGNYFNGTFGASSNTLEISYKYKKSTDSTYTTVNLVNNTDYKISGNTYYSGTGSSKQTITLAPTFDYKTQYDVQVVIKDKLTTLPTINAIISKGIPIMWWNGEKVQVNGDLYLADENSENATPLNVSGNVSKNLFDKDNLYIGYNVNSSTGELETNASYNATNFIKVNGTITVSFSGKTANYNKIFVGEYDENKNFITRQTNATTTSLQYQFTLNGNTKYIRFSHRNDVGITNVQLEKGSTATGYEERYVKLSIRDSNDEFQEVIDIDDINKNNYSLGEQKIGTWIDGKPLYRKVVTYSTKITSGTVQIPHGIGNLDTVIKCDYMAKWDGKNYPAPIIYSEYTKQVIVNFVGNGYIYVKSFGETWDVYTLTVILEYTKTTN